MNGQFETGDISPSRYFFSIAIILGVLFAFIAPSRHEFPLLTFIQWQLQTVIPIALLIVTHRLLLNSQYFAMLNRWLTLTISGVIGASLFTPVASLIDLVIEPSLSAPSILDELVNEWLGMMPPVVICWLALNWPFQLGYRLQKLNDKPNQAQEKVEELNLPKFMTLLPHNKRGKLLFLKSELHYIQVCTDKSSTLILYSLSDAIDEIPESYGLQVHRSYWVAYDAIQEVIAKGRQGELGLIDGSKIPISRSKFSSVKKQLESN